MASFIKKVVLLKMSAKLNNMSSDMVDVYSDPSFLPAYWSLTIYRLLQSAVYSSAVVSSAGIAPKRAWKALF